jgi:hypothetical protein
MTPFANGLWFELGPVRILGMRLTTTMTVLRLHDGSVVVHSPLPLTAERRAAVEALGPVAHLYAPSRYHDLRIAEWAAAFPSARLHAPRGLMKERPELRVDRVIAETSEPAFHDIIDELPIEGFRLEETVLLYRPARTLIVADLVHNIGRPQGWWTQFYTGAMGFYDNVALSRAIRWLAFNDRAAARGSIDNLLRQPFDSVIVGHGTPITTGAREALANAFTWLPPARH